MMVQLVDRLFETCVLFERNQALRGAPLSGEPSGGQSGRRVVSDVSRQCPPAQPMRVEAGPHAHCHHGALPASASADLKVTSSLPCLDIAKEADVVKLELGVVDPAVRSCHSFLLICCPTTSWTSLCLHVSLVPKWCPSSFILFTRCSETNVVSF